MRALLSKSHVCNIITRGHRTYHYTLIRLYLWNGHSKQLLFQRRFTNTIDPKSLKTKTQANTIIDGFYCSLCGVQLRNAKTFKKHQSTKKHITNMQTQSNPCIIDLNTSVNACQTESEDGVADTMTGTVESQIESSKQRVYQVLRRLKQQNNSEPVSSVTQPFDSMKDKESIKSLLKTQLSNCEPITVTDDDHDHEEFEFKYDSYEKERDDESDIKCIDITDTGEVLTVAVTKLKS
eukprot:140901_1